MVATADRRSARSTAPGVSKGTAALAMRTLARVMRCSIAASLTRKARAICLTLQAGDDAQRQRDLLGRRQVRMAADEQEAQDVVAVMRAVEPLGERHLGFLEVGDQLRPAGAALSGRCGARASIAALRPTRISQAAGSRGGPFRGQACRARRQASW